MAISVPQSRLITNTIMAVLRDSLAASELVDWEVHSQEMNDRNGFIVSEQVEPDFVVTQTTGAVQDLTAGVQDTVFGAQTFTLNRVFGLSFGASDIESVVAMGAARKARALTSGIATLAAAIDAHIFDVAAKAYNYSTGTWGNPITTPMQFTAARTRLAEASVESDRDLAGVLTPGDFTNLGTFIYNGNAGLASEGSRALRKGFDGEAAGIPLRRTNGLGVVTTGTRVAAVVAGAAQNVNYSAVANAGATAAGYLTQTLNLTTEANATIKAGEVFQIAGVAAYNPHVGVARPFNQQFVVISDATANGAGAITVSIFPAIIVPTPGAATGAAANNTAHATVSAAPANGATVTLMGSPSTAYRPRMMWKKESMVVHSAPLVQPFVGDSFRRSLADAQANSKVPPLMPRVWFFSDPKTGSHSARVDVFVQAQVRNRWQGIKFFG